MDDLKSLLDDLRELAKKNLWLIGIVGAVAVGLVVVLVGMSALSASRAKAGTEPAATTEAATTEAATDAVPEATPTEEQAKLISSYTSDQSDLVGTLASLPWVTPKGSKVTFSKDAYVDVDNKVHAYAVSAVSKPETTTASLKDNVVTTVTIEKSTFSVLDDEGKTYLCELNVMTDNNGTTRTITGSPFADGETVTAMESATELTLDVPQSLSDLVGGKADALVAQVRKWATANAPAASIARWDQKSTEDHEAGTVKFQLTLNDQLSTKVDVTYDSKASTFDIQAVKA